MAYMMKPLTLIVLLALISSSSLGLAVAQALKLQANNSCTLVTFIPFTDTREGRFQELSIEETINDNRRRVTANNTRDTTAIYGAGTWPDAPTLAKTGFSFLAAAELARMHFNTRDASIIPELAEWGDCNITFPDSSLQSLYYDTQCSKYIPTERMMEMAHEIILESGGTQDEDDAVCAIIGPLATEGVEGLSVISHRYQIPHLSYANSDSRFHDNLKYPYYTSLIPAITTVALTVRHYIQRDVWHRECLTVMFEQTDYGIQWQQTLLYAPQDGSSSLVVQIASFIDVPTSLDISLQKVKRFGCRTVLLATDRPYLVQSVAETANKLGMVDGDYFWLLAGAAVPPSMLSSWKYPVGSSADKLLRGAAIITNYDPFVYNGESDPFLQAWRKQDGALVAQLNAIQPKDEGTGEPFYVADASYFQTETPTEYASFMYDTIMATGLSACKALLAPDDDPYKNDHDGSLLEYAFHGASGEVKFRHGVTVVDHTSGRKAHGVMLGVLNIRAASVADDNMTSYKAVLTSVYSNACQVNALGPEADTEACWYNMEEDFVFADGSSNEPLPKRTIQDENYLSVGVQIAGLLLSSLSVATAVGSAAWIFWKRKTRLITASQPEFLYLLCFGAALVGSSTFFLSFDESNGYSTTELSALCSAFPWFFVIGYLFMYCALFSKLWRLSKLLSMRRRAVQVRHVLVPFVLIIACSVVLLIVWQVVSPMQWVRDEIQAFPLVTYGSCQSVPDGQLPFVIPLGFLFAIIIIMACVLAWRLRDVQPDLAESRWIFFGVILHVQTWLIGIPIVVITAGVSKNASYIMIVALAFVFSASLVGLVIFPKMYMFYNKLSSRATPTISVSHANTHVSGLNTTEAKYSHSSEVRFASEVDEHQGDTWDVHPPDGRHLESAQSLVEAGRSDQVENSSSSNGASSVPPCESPKLEMASIPEVAREESAASLPTGR